MNLDRCTIGHERLGSSLMESIALMTPFFSPPTHMRQPNSKGVQNVCNYLGHHITQSLIVGQEVDQRTQQTTNTWLKLKAFWKASHCTRWKLRVYYVIQSWASIHGTGDHLCSEWDCFWTLGTCNRVVFLDPLLKKRVALSGHFLRTDDNDPLQQTTYEPSAACGSPI